MNSDPFTAQKVILSKFSEMEFLESLSSLFEYHILERRKYEEYESRRCHHAVDSEGPQGSNVGSLLFSFSIEVFSLRNGFLLMF